MLQENPSDSARPPAKGTPARRWSDRLAQRTRIAAHLHDPERRTGPVRLLVLEVHLALWLLIMVSALLGALGVARTRRDAPSPAP